MWNLQELQDARPYINNDISADAVAQRYHQVGRVPRNIFENDEDFSDVLKAQTNAINALTKDQLKNIAQRGWNAMSDFSYMQTQSAILGYERPGVDYMDANVSPISKMVRETVITKCQMLFYKISS
jgi:hypothetical protein